MGRIHFGPFESNERAPAGIEIRRSSPSSIGTKLPGVTRSFVFPSAISAVPAAAKRRRSRASSDAAPGFAFRLKTSLWPSARAAAVPPASRTLTRKLSPGSAAFPLPAVNPKGASASVRRLRFSSEVNSGSGVRSDVIGIKKMGKTLKSLPHSPTGVSPGQTAPGSRLPVRSRSS